MKGILTAAAPILALLAATAAARPPDPGSELIETRQLALLAQVEAGGALRQPFTTDGCSGGLSEGWSWLAQQPRYAALFGRQPPWEACCVIHDWSYWGGGSSDGYARRLAADTALHHCVVASGARQAAAIGARLELSPAAVIGAFSTAADLMFVAVRLGGAPCTPLPWRWGYGLPPCPVLAP